MVDSPAASSPANEQNGVNPEAGNSDGQGLSLDSLFAGLEIRSEADLDQPEAEASPAAGTTAPQVEQSATGAETTPAAEAPANAAETTPAASPDVDWDPSLPFGTHPRWKAKIESERRALEKAAAAEAQVEQYRQALAGQSPEDLAPLARLRSLLQSPDPAVADEAYRELQNIQAQLAPLARSAKPVLPADLAEKVEAGLIPEELAEEIVRTRGQLQARERQIQSYEQQQIAAREQAFAASIQSSVRAERETWKADSLYETKLPLISAELTSLIQGFGYPKTPEAAVMMAKMAKIRVDALPEFVRPAQAPAPKKSPIAPISEGGVSTRTVPPADNNDPFAGLGIRFV